MCPPTQDHHLKVVCAIAAWLQCRLEPLGFVTGPFLTWPLLQVRSRALGALGCCVVCGPGTRVYAAFVVDALLCVVRVAMSMLVPCGAPTVPKASWQTAAEFHPKGCGDVV